MKKLSEFLTVDNYTEMLYPYLENANVLLLPTNEMDGALTGCA